MTSPEFTDDEREAITRIRRGENPIDVAADCGIHPGRMRELLRQAARTDQDDVADDDRSAH